MGRQADRILSRQEAATALECRTADFQTMQIGDEWVRAGKSVALAVPSVLSASEMNFLLNPKHPDFKKIKISQPVDYRFDSRLLNR